MDQVAAKKILQDLIKKEELDNKRCVDCGNPNPQWASLSFAVFLCLQCAGVHRGFGVHISFVRSVSMDTWQEEQIKRMQLGGNKPVRDFMKSYPGRQGGYSEDLNAYDTYHCWAGSQYRSKLDADLAGRDWSPSEPPASPPPSGTMSPTDRPSSAQGLRKSRASGRATSSRPSRADSGSPASFNGPASPSSGIPALSPDQKSANEDYFARLGSANASRPEDLPPSQGGRYAGFGSTPAPARAAHPSFGLSSAAAPSLADFQENPSAALSKGWSLFSAAVAGASRVVAENVIQPGLERVSDPTFQAGVRGAVTSAGQRAVDVGRGANAWGRQAFGVDVAEQVGGVAGIVRDRVGGGPQGRGYASVDPGYAESSALYQDGDGEEDGFEDWNTVGKARSTGLYGATSSSVATSRPAAGSAAAPTPAKKQNDWDDEWKDF